MARIRTFVAIEIDDAIRSNAVALQKLLGNTGADVKWVEPHNLHVTLVFLGDVHERELGAVCLAVTRAAAREPAFTLRVSGVGAFPTPRRPKTLWAGITEGAAEIIRLHTALEQPLLELGCYRQEERAYTPHLTLGRVSAEDDTQLLATELPKHLAWNGGQTAIEQVVIFTSELRREGPEYTVIGRAKLAMRSAE